MNGTFTRPGDVAAPAAQEPPRDGSPLLALRLAELVRHPSHGVREPSRLRTLAELMATIEAFVTGHPRNVVS